MCVYLPASLSVTTLAKPFTLRMGYVQYLVQVVLVFKLAEYEKTIIQKLWPEKANKLMSTTAASSNADAVTFPPNFRW